MKKIFLSILAGIAIAGSAMADNQPKVLGLWDVPNAALRLTPDKQQMHVSCDIDLSQLRVPTQEAVLFTPMLVNGQDTLRLSSAGVYGRSRYYYYLRHSLDMLSGADEAVYRNHQRPDKHQVDQTVPFLPWMNGARLLVQATCYGCCFTPLGQNERGMARLVLPPTMPSPAYVTADAITEVVDSLEGSACIQFVVDRTEIRPDWRDNYRELGKITHSIDTIKADPDLTITQLWLKGFASPESPYKHNTDLARGRTQSLRDYIQHLYNFDPAIMATDYEPEDWAGLRRYVAESNMDNRDAILALIDEPMADLDRKEAELKRRFPQDYRFLLEHAYPPLRHTEYKVKYRVRRFYDVEEIKRVMEVNPRKLTLNDFHLVAKTYEPGSDDFNYVYMLAAQLHPQSPEANLNAANAALQRGDAQQAEAYLQKTDQRPEAEYARALLLLLREQYAQALPGVQKAAQQNIPGAKELQKDLENYLGNNK